MNHCFETGDFPESTRMTVTEVHSMTKEAFEKATNESILSKKSRNAIDKELPPSENEFETILHFVTEQNEVV